MSWKERFGELAESVRQKGAEDERRKDAYRSAEMEIVSRMGPLLEEMASTLGCTLSKIAYGRWRLWLKHDHCRPGEALIYVGTEPYKEAVLVVYYPTIDCVVEARMHRVEFSVLDSLGVGENSLEHRLSKAIEQCLRKHLKQP